MNIKIDFVSDVSCPWCAVGLGGLEKALAAIAGDVEVELHFQPFELNPAMGADGQDVAEHLTQKYGSTAEQQAQMREHLQQRGNDVGFTFNADGRGRIWNTFDAHRLLHLAQVEGGSGQQIELKKSLLAACHTYSKSMSDHAVLIESALNSGMNETRVKEVLKSDEFTQAVRERQRFYTDHGIHSVPAVIINDEHLISGAQPVEVFEQALLKLRV